MGNIEVRDLKKIYGGADNPVTALSGVSFSLDIGEFVVILGPSGSGKSTLLNILGGMDSASEGSVEVAGKDIVRFSEKQLVTYRRNDIGFVFQFYNLMQNLTALENVALSESVGGMEAAEALRLVGLEKLFYLAISHPVVSFMIFEIMEWGLSRSILKISWMEIE